MLNAVEFGTDHHETSLALVNAGQEALVDHLATGLPTALEVLTGALGNPFARLVVAAIHTKLNELCNGVLLDVVVAGPFKIRISVSGTDLSP